MFHNLRLEISLLYIILLLYCSSGKSKNNKCDCQSQEIEDDKFCKRQFESLLKCIYEKGYKFVYCAQYPYDPELVKSTFVTIAKKKLKKCRKMEKTYEQRCGCPEEDLSARSTESDTMLHHLDNLPIPAKVMEMTPHLTCFLDDGTDYQGFVSTTCFGYTCQKWSDQSPHVHEHHGGLTGDHNYCRNPDGGTGPWCYTTDPDVRWSYCAVPSCRNSQCNKGQARAQNFFAPISINLVPKVV